MTAAVEALSALAQTGRLAAFRALVEAGPSGLAAGALADRLEMPSSTLSSHLGILSRAGLVVGQREGRSIRYLANFEAMGALLTFLVKDCCQGAPELCGPMARSLDGLRCGVRS